jgi:hypothetical protein
MRSLWRGAGTYAVQHFKHMSAEETWVGLTDATLDLPDWEVPQGCTGLLELLAAFAETYHVLSNPKNSACRQVHISHTTTPHSNAES